MAPSPAPAGQQEQCGGISKLAESHWLGTNFQHIAAAAREAGAAQHGQQDQRSFAMGLLMAVGQPETSFPLHQVFALCLLGLKPVQGKTLSPCVLLLLDEAPGSGGTCHHQWDHPHALCPGPGL